jgi:hypothetical protein
MSRVVAIHQPNYLPWLGYFYKMAYCDMFVVLDDVLHSKSSVTSRCQIKAREGAKLLSVPLATKEVRINETAICNDGKWQLKHWHAMENAYRSSIYWNEYNSYFEHAYRGTRWSTLSQLNVFLIMTIRTILDLNNKIILSSELGAIGGERSNRNLEICRSLAADAYLSGTGARSYNDEEAFRKAGVDLIYSDFEHPVYRQLWGDFVPNLSIVDLLFNEGGSSLDILKASCHTASDSTLLQ